MTRIYLIRHAEAEGNLYRIAQGQYDSLVTDRGMRQIAALEKRFEGVRIDAVYSSDLYRTCVTAGALYIPRRLPLHRMPALREICVGEWEQKTWGEIAQRWPEEMVLFNTRLDLWSAKGAETAEQVRDRMLSALREITAANDGKTVALFSHGCAIRILLATIQGYSIAQVGETPLGTNTAVSLVESDGDGWRVVFRDDASHLTDDLTRKRGGPRPLDPGLIFTALSDAGQADRLRAFAGENGLDPEPLIRDNASRPVFLGELDGAVVGALQLDEPREAERKRGWVTLCHIAAGRRKHGYGVQLLGQAVAHYRPLGREALCAAVSGDDGDALLFCGEYGFHPTGEVTPEGLRVLEKDIAFHPLKSFS